MKRKLYYIANFENERAKDIGRGVITSAGLVGGGIIGSELGNQYQIIGGETDLKYYDDILRDPNLDEKIKNEARQNILDTQKSIEKSKKGSFLNKPLNEGFELKNLKDKRVISDLLTSVSKPKLVGTFVGAGALGLGVSTIGEKILPNERFKDRLAYEGAKEKRREVSSLNQTSREFRGWANAARRIGQL